MALAFVLIGGVIGAVGRYLVGILSRMLCPDNKEYITTFMINGAGSLALGLVIGSTLQFALLTGITVGLIGSFTTFSTFALDCVKLILEKKWTICFSYIAGTVLISTGLFSLGYYII